MNAPTTTPEAMEKPRETYRRLHALATNTSATDAERASARSIMARYIARYGSEVEIPESEPTTAREVTYGNEYEDRLAIHCALFAGCKAMALGRRLYEGTKREKFKDDGKTVRFVGPESAVDAAAELYEHHRVMIRRLLDLAENGYRFGAMPLPNAVKTAPAEPMAPEMVAALRAAAKAGAANAASKRLGNGGT